MTGSVLAVHCCTFLQGHPGYNDTCAGDKRRRRNQVRLYSEAAGQNAVYQSSKAGGRLDQDTELSEVEARQAAVAFVSSLRHGTCIHLLKVHACLAITTYDTHIQRGARTPEATPAAVGPCNPGMHSEVTSFCEMLLRGLQLSNSRMAA